MKLCGAVLGIWILASFLPGTLAAEEDTLKTVKDDSLQTFLWQQDRPAALRREARRARPSPPSPQLLERLRNLSPEERERILRNNRRFQQLPPERQEQLRDRLRRLQELPPEQREMIEQRFAIFQNLTPRQQERAREIYEQRWKNLPPDRRRALLQQFRKLRAMDAAEREKFLSGKEVESQFSPEEREVLKALISL